MCGRGSRLFSRVEHLAGVESVRETRSSRSTDETSPRCRQTGSEHWQRSASAVKGQPGSRSPCCATYSQRPKASRGQGHQRCATYSQRSKASRGQGHRVVRPTLSDQRPAKVKVTALCDLLSAVKGQPGSRSPRYATYSQRSKAIQGQGHRRSPRGSTHHPQSSHAGCRVASPVHRAVS